MKNNTFSSLLIACALVITSCSYSKSNGESELKIGTISFGNNEGKGNLTDKSYTFDFDEIKTSNALDVEVIKSNSEKIVVNAPSDIIDQIEVVQEGTSAIIRVVKGTKNLSTNRVKVKVYARDFNKLTSSSSSTITLADSFKSDKFDIQATSSSTIKGNFDAPNISLQVSSSADFIGQIISKNLSVQGSSSATIGIKGRSENFSAQASSSADIEGADYVTDNASLQASSSAGIKVGVRNTVNATASSSADIVILKRGDLKNITVKESSSGSISVK